MSTNDFPADFFERQDMSDDSFFYSSPRKVVHIDANAISALKDVYLGLLPVGGTYLDLMSSWRSHYPPELKPSRVVGLGMNADEMRDNEQLDKYVVHNLNQNPTLPYDSNLFDAVTCTVSVQYLTDPVSVFAEVNRVLKPGGVFVVSFSNRCFPNKAVAIWLSSSDEQHIALVGQYFQLSAKWTDLTAQKTNPAEGYPPQANPLYVVWARKAA
ncbi:MAG: class I SAM-dependent methyltransferase [Chloroflexota bacterium]